MSYKSPLTLESYRFAQCSEQVPCYICGEGNTYEVELCRYCYAPMALAHQANCQKVRPQMVACLGSAGAGKTVFLGMMLDMLSRHSDRLQLLARGAFSITLQQNTMASLSRCEFPEKTPNEPDRWNWVHCQVRSPRRRAPVELIMPDMAGEAISQELEHAGAFPAVKSFLQKCSGVMLLIDVSRLEEGGQDQDYFGMKALAYLLALDDHRKRGWPSRPVAVVFTKGDQSEACLRDPEGYAERYTPGLWKQCREHFTRQRIFAESVAGSCAWRYERGGRVCVPLRVEPRGVVEPFQWLVSQLG